MENLSIIRTPELIATEINSIKAQTRNLILYNQIEIGRKLTEAKSLLPHGEWGDWLQANVDYSKSTANNLMKLFDEYGSSQITLLSNNIENPIFEKLSYSQAVALLGLPAEEREAFVESHDMENTSTRDMQKEIDKLKEKLKNAKDNAVKAFEERDKTEKDKEKIQKDLDALQKEKKDSSDKIHRLQLALAETDQKLKSAQAPGNDDEIQALHESMKTLDDELAEAKKKNEELERQLKEKPIEAAATKEVIPPEVERELEELRKKASPEIIKFTICFESVKKSVADLALVLNEMKDPDTKDKYREAAIKFLDIIKNKL